MFLTQFSSLRLLSAHFHIKESISVFNCVLCLASRNLYESANAVLEVHQI